MSSLDRCLSLGIASPTIFMGFSFMGIGINVKSAFRILKSPPECLVNVFSLLVLTWFVFNF